MQFMLRNIPPLITPLVLIADMESAVIEVTTVVVKIKSTASPNRENAV